jgi:hypothetical protein
LGHFVDDVDALSRVSSKYTKVTKGVMHAITKKRRRRIRDNGREAFIRMFAALPRDQQARFR